MNGELCPCGKSIDYKDCCEPVIKKQKPAETAEELMRSRYTAFVKNEMAHIKDSHDPSTRTELDMEGNQAWASKAEWKGLEIQNVSGGGPEDSTGTVEFVANYTMDGKPQSHREHSTFKKVKGQWYFVDGKNLSVSTFQREQPKVGRNDPCPCGSGKKYKKCCG